MCIDTDMQVLKWLKLRVKNELLKGTYVNVPHYLSEKLHTLIYLLLASVSFPILVCNSRKEGNELFILQKYYCHNWINNIHL